METVKKSIVKKVYPKRKNWSHKYDFGHLLVIGGSKLYSGSPALNALAALRSGVDLVTVLAPERAANIIASFSPDLITYPLAGNCLKIGHLEEVMKFCQNKEAVVIGGGLGREAETFTFVLEFLEKINLPCVIDADAIHAVAKRKSILAEKKFLLTPHAREFYILSGKEVGNDINSRVKLVKQVASSLKTTILLKGFMDVISDGKRVVINKTGNPYMTVGGTGDTLSGICGALLARGNDVFTAACASTYINGLAGDLAAKKKKESLIASDLLDEIQNAIKL